MLTESTHHDPNTYPHCHIALPLYLKRLSGNDIPPSDVEEMQEYASGNVELRAVAEVTCHTSATMMTMMLMVIGAAVGGTYSRLELCPLQPEAHKSTKSFIDSGSNENASKLITLSSISKLLQKSSFFLFCW